MLNLISVVLILSTLPVRLSPVSSSNTHPHAPATLKFDFGPGRVAPGYTQIKSETIYSREQGYGFEPGVKVACIERHINDPLRSDFCTSDQPFFFSVTLPEGNYNVTVTLGDSEEESRTTIKAELRRLMLETVELKRGQFARRTFTVNIRTPAISGGGEVKLKPREKSTEIWAWDDKLTLEFNNARPCIAALEISRVENIPTIYLLGDSTVCDQPREPYNSWGQMLTRFLLPGIAVANHAESGESLRSSLSARRLDKVLSIIKPGDYLFIQYGHNDEKEKGEGVGAFTTYKADLRRFVSETRNQGGIPVLITPVQRRTFDAQKKITNSHGDYPDAVRQVAREDSVALIDLQEMSTRFYEALGPEGSLIAFKDGDATHHSSYGSYELAKCIVEGIKSNHLKIARYVVKDLKPFDPGRPDDFQNFHIPPSPDSTKIKPDGN
jgi:lysophospholipase L1-like esterase